MADFANLDTLRSLLGPDAYIEAGWIPPRDRSREVNRSAERLICEMEHPISSLVVAEEGLSLDEEYLKNALEDGVFFWEFEEALLGKTLEIGRQTIGDCVSWGSKHICSDQIVIEAACSGGHEQFVAEVATEPIYSGCRVEIGGGRLSGDGALGVWAMKWVTQYGIILRLKYGNIDLTTYDGGRARSWGGRGNGCPDELEPIAKQHPISDGSLCQSADDAIPILANLNGITTASNVGFTSKRDKRGICRRSGTWNHQMGLRGVFMDKSGEILVPQQNSWADYLGSTNNKVTTYSGREVTLPAGCYLTTMEDLNVQLRQGDSFAHSGVRGWRKQDLAVQVYKDHIASKYTSGKRGRKTKQGA